MADEVCGGYRCRAADALLAVDERCVARCDGGVNEVAGGREVRVQIGRVRVMAACEDRWKSGWGRGASRTRREQGRAESEVS